MILARSQLETCEAKARLERTLEKLLMQTEQDYYYATKRVIYYEQTGL